MAGIVAHSFGAAATTVALRDPLPVGRVVYLAPCEDFDHFPKVFSAWLGLPRALSERMRHSIEGRLGITMAALRGKLLAPGMRVPLLVVHDEDDTEVPWQDGRTYTDVWPDSTLLTTRGLGHRRILREPSVTTSVAQFFGESPKP